jgi:general secretion pathway protein L
MAHTGQARDIPEESRMSEIRLYLRRDSLLEGTDCAWSLLDDAGQLRGSGAHLEDLPRAQHCRLVLAGDLVLTVKTPLPDLPERRLAPLLPAAVEAVTLVEADTIHVVMMARGMDNEAILAVLEEAWLRRILDKLAELGLYPDCALPDYLLLPWNEGDWSIGWRGVETVARFGSVEGMSLDDGEPPIGLTLALAQRSRPQQMKVFQGGNMGVPDWERWREVLGTRVETAGPWDWRTCPWPDLPDLLQGKHSPGRSRMDWTRLARPLAWGALLLAGIQLAGMTLDWGLLARESANIRQEMHDLAERALPAHAAVVDPPWQVTEQIQTLRSASGNPSPDALVGLLGRLGQIWPTTASPQIKTLTFEAGSLSVLLAEADADWLRALKAAAPSRGLEITDQEEKDKGKGVRLSVRPIGKEVRHAQ